MATVHPWQDTAGLSAGTPSPGPVAAGGAAFPQVFGSKHNPERNERGLGLPPSSPAAAPLGGSLEEGR